MENKMTKEEIVVVAKREAEETLDNINYLMGKNIKNGLNPYINDLITLLGVYDYISKNYEDEPFAFEVELKYLPVDSGMLCYISTWQIEYKIKKLFGIENAKVVYGEDGKSVIVMLNK